MQSFRTELENPIVEQDIIELEKKIRLFNEGQIDEERFRSLRLARGVYGQRQPGVQMVRIKLPYGKVTSEQLHRIADVADEYSTGRLHITTRQDIQIHHVSLDRTPELWSKLAKDDITIREACGNTVRNVTASATAGIDPKEPFDASPYAHAVFQFFLRNPVCQEMGRKFKISFSGTDEDTALSFLHDLGFIAKIKQIDGKETRGFKVMIGGGLGSQPREADVAFQFLPQEKIIPFIEGVLRVFDRYGERNRRAKARMKFLIKDIGLDAFLELVNQEQQALSTQTWPIAEEEDKIELPSIGVEVNDLNHSQYTNWLNTNVIAQKQEGLYAIGVKVPLGDFYTDKARLLANLIKNYAGNEFRLTLRQNILIKHVRQELLPFFYQELLALGFADLGYNSTTDITACPGTDTCNLGIASSTGIASELEKVLVNEFPQFVNNKSLTIKISGCMNACGQHNMAHIGFQGMSIKSGKLVAPALQVLLGGGVLGDGQGRFADKVIKIPSKRGPQALRLLFKDYQTNGLQESFLDYYDKQGQKYFYNLLKPLADTSNLTQDEFIDWGTDEAYVKAIGVGECAGVVIDLVSTLLFESEEKLANAQLALELDQYADSIYHTYSALVNTAKAVLVDSERKTNTQKGIVKDFQETLVDTGIISLEQSFEDLVFQINKKAPTQEFAQSYLNEAHSFYNKINALRADV